MPNVGHGISIKLSASPSRAPRGTSSSYEVRIKNGTTIDWKVVHENHIRGTAIEFDGCNPTTTWLDGPFVPANATFRDVQGLKVLATGKKGDEFVSCVSVERRDPVGGAQPVLCTHNVPVTLRIQVT
jgi:hypothetical protein